MEKRTHMWHKGRRLVNLKSYVTKSFAEVGLAVSSFEVRRDLEVIVAIPQIDKLSKENEDNKLHMATKLGRSIVKQLRAQSKLKWKFVSILKGHHSVYNSSMALRFSVAKA